MGGISMIDLCRLLVDAPDDDYIGVAADQLQHLLGSDDVFWILTDWRAADFVAWRRSKRSRDSACEAVLPTLYQHPAVQSYVQTPQDLTPRRLSDLPPSRDDAQTIALESSKRSIGRDQLFLILDVSCPVAGHGWVATRNGPEFDSGSLCMATSLLPLLLVFDHFRQPDLARPAPQERGGAWDQLTARERQVADLLRSGMTARAIGRVLGISDRTVEKHLENVYRKLGCHDRLLVAVDEARRR